jgi:hypothetical protein
LAGSTTKKVLIRRFDREPLNGFVNPQTYLSPGGVELLKTEGTVTTIPYREIKTVCFVKDFDSPEASPEPRVFHTRPKMDGLWVRMRFRDGEIMDGILSNNLLQIEPYGFTFIPPEPYSNNQRIFSPREALSELHVLGVVGSPLTRRRRKEVPKEQIGLFEQEEAKPEP